MRRRRAAQIMASGLAGSFLACSNKPREKWRFLTSDEGRTLTALCEQIIPTDGEPGAAWAGVVNFIDIQLAKRPQFRASRRVYRDGLAGVEQASVSGYGRRFDELRSEEQVELMQKMERGKLPPGPAGVSLASFFDLVVGHTKQGYYGDPRHGGNRDGVSWQVIGVPFIPVRGREQYDLSKRTAATRKVRG